MPKQEIKRSDGKTTIILDADKQTISVLDGRGGEKTKMDGWGITAGGKGNHGLVVLKDGRGKTMLLFDGYTGEVRALNRAQNEAVGLSGGRNEIWLNNAAGTQTVLLSGKTGDITLPNADCAEHFDIAESEQIEPGAVMIIDRERKLRQSTEPYDKKVVGVVSGAGDLKPGIVLDKRESLTASSPWYKSVFHMTHAICAMR
jgi:hypothetical protein